MAAAPELNEALAAFERGDLQRAREIAERELKSSSSAALQHLLGLIECRQGRFDSAIAWLRRASDAEPGNLGFKVMLVRALVDSGHALEALDLTTEITGTSPPELALWHARAEAAEAAGEPDAALEAWERLCSLGVSNWRAWARYGESLAAAGRWQQASVALKCAVDLEPGQASLRRSLAVSLARDGRVDEAADELLRWIEQTPQDLENRMLLSRLLADLGRGPESDAQLNKAAEIATGRPFEQIGQDLLALATVGGEVQMSPLSELSRLLERTNRIDALSKLLDQAEEAGIGREELPLPAAAVAFRSRRFEEARRLLESDKTRADPLRWHGLMARIADAMGEPETAFAEAEAMNHSVPDRDSWLATASRRIEAVRAVASSVTPSWAARVHPLEAAGPRTPAFLVGFPRSGTTLLDTFLMGHPRAMVLEELPLIQHAKDALGNTADLAQRSPAELRNARNRYFEELDRHVPAGFDGLVIDKLPLNMLTGRILYALFPDARIIFAQRHPCDCVLSCFMQPFMLNDSMACFLELDRAAAYYDAAMTLWSKCAELLPLKVHTLVYERLIENPEASLRPLVDFLGLEWDGELLDHRSTALARGAISTPSYDQVVQPLTKSASGRWRKYEKQLSPVLPLLLPWAERLGYET